MCVAKKLQFIGIVTLRVLSIKDYSIIQSIILYSVERKVDIMVEKAQSLFMTEVSGLSYYLALIRVFFKCTFVIFLFLQLCVYACERLKQIDEIERFTPVIMGDFLYAIRIGFHYCLGKCSGFNFFGI